MNKGALILKKIKQKVINKLSNREELSSSKLSFSQSGEDLIVKFIFDYIGFKTPSYIDIGAHHPYFINNTALFYKNGSRGINVEPDPTLFPEFLKSRKEDINLNIGISDKIGLENFYVVSTPTLNTFSKQEAEKYCTQGNFKIDKIIKVEVNTLQNVLNQFWEGKFPEFLNIDAEGIDDLIVKEIDFKKNFPIVICVETITFSTNGNGIKNIDLINFITNNGYIHYADTNINSIFVRKECWIK